MNTIQVTCAIIQFDNKILAVQRSETMKLPLKWEFAGGKIEKGETEIDCIKREIFEQINRESELADRYGIDTAFQPFGTKAPVPAIVEEGAENV